jgi:hypothetical protein
MWRLLFCLPVLMVLAVSPAEAAPAAQKKPPEKAAAPAKEADRTEPDYKAQRERDEARQRLWDRKMKALTGSICTGC